jgi:hypothetical protein
MFCSTSKSLQARKVLQGENFFLLYRFYPFVRTDTFQWKQLSEISTVSEFQELEISPSNSTHAPLTLQEERPDLSKKMMLS